MGQLNLLEEMLAAIRRKKKLYTKNLEDGFLSENQKESLIHDIDVLNDEERRILQQLDYDKIF